MSDYEFDIKLRRTCKTCNGTGKRPLLSERDYEMMEEFRKKFGVDEIESTDPDERSPGQWRQLMLFIEAQRCSDCRGEGKTTTWMTVEELVSLVKEVRDGLKEGQ